MTARKPVTTLPKRAFKALDSTAFDTLIDRAEQEVIVMTRRGMPELVLVSHADWNALVEAAAKRQVPAQTGMPAEDHS